MTEGGLENMTEAHHGIWITERAGLAGSSYHMAIAVTFDGDLDAGSLAAACAGLVARHPALGSVVVDDDGVPRLVPGPVAPALVRVAAPADVEGFVAAEVRRGFDLAGGPLARFTLVSVGPGRHLLLVVAHHLVFDGMSKDVLVRDLADLYAGTDLPPLPPPPPVTGDAAAAEFWQARWREPAEAVLPGFRRAPLAAVPGEAVEFTLDAASLDERARAIGVTRFEWVLAAVQALLYRYGNAEPVVSVDLSTRTGETAGHIGLFVNELPVFAPPAQGSFAEFARAVRAEVRELYRFRTVPLTRAVGGFTPRAALTPVSVSYRRRAAAPAFAGVGTRVDWAMFNGAARNALHVQVVDDGAELAVSLQYSPGSVDAAGIAGHLRTLLASALVAPDTALGDLAVLPEAERRLLLDDWNATDVAYPAGETVVSMFAAQAAATPSAPAVVFEGRTVSYGGLDAAANRLAHRLRREGVGAGTLVALRVERSVEMVVALLGILKAGGAYVPLDPAYPAERLAFVLEDAGAPLILTRAPSPSDPKVVLLDDPSLDDEPSTAPASPPGPGDLAYAIYTSGSTGRPKGVEIRHEALLNLLLSMRDTIGATPADVWLGLTSLSFDIAGLELFLPLVTGARVVVVPEATTRDGAAQLRLVASAGVTHVQATPSGWQLLLDAGFDALPVVALAGGEALPVPLARAVRSRVRRLFNVYGPTETTIWSTCDEIAPDVESVAIGRPIANTRVYLLDDALTPVPPGVPGELCIGGTGLARGYHERPELTGSKFVETPYGRLYRTGDRARYRPDGRIEFLGRVDNQVKLRGHRIELGEIEARLVEHPEVTQAAVVVRDDGLVAYTVGNNGADLRGHLSRTLPSYMLPGAYVTLDRLPLTPNGKLDRAALPAPAREVAEPASRAPVDGIARDIAEIFAEVLRLDQIGPDEDLFDLGGHSLTITQIMARIRKRLGIEVPLDVFFDAPTVAGVVAAIEDSRKG